ncbi:PA0069 family radical SAM protein [Gaopeijia maritima]|uniref:PA0069 family radical SAM protein n=1 Tax=Gaopeijia maritima TaxID=3119007 RepID=UPI003293BF71
MARSLPSLPPPSGRSRPGRGTPLNPASRFDPLDVEPEPGSEVDQPSTATRFFRDASRSVLVHNDSPDVGASVGLNPYRGCEHGCVYCFARPNHEYLGFSAGLDFESRIMVKHRAPELLREQLRRPGWTPRTIMLSGATDPWQPVERRLRVTRRCLEVFAEARHPVGVITKNDGVVRDLDLLLSLAEHDAVAVTLSITTLRRDLQKVMEPRTSTPRARLTAIRTLAEAGIPVGVNLAPVIPGLTDEEIPAILEAAREAGAQWAGYILLRLPHGVSDLFEDWLQAWYPDRRDRVLNRLREVYGGKLYDATYGVRGRGRGVFADQLRALFRTTASRLGYVPPPELNTKAFRRPAPEGQLTLF